MLEKTNPKLNSDYLELSKKLKLCITEEHINKTKILLDSFIKYNEQEA